MRTCIWLVREGSTGRAQALTGWGVFVHRAHDLLPSLLLSPLSSTLRAAIGLHQLCSFWCFLKLLFNGWLCWKEASMLAVMLIFWDYAHAYAPSVTVDYAKRRQPCSRLCSFFRLLLLTLHSHVLFCFWLGSAPFSPLRPRASFPEPSCFGCTLFYNFAPHHKLFPENLSADVFRAV